jgi:hypothetical protein
MYHIIYLLDGLNEFVGTYKNAINIITTDRAKILYMDKLKEG